MDTEHNAIIEPVRRLEVFTGAGRRRTWRDEDKARIVAEIATSGDSVCAVARRHGLSPQQLFGWRRQFRECRAGPSEADGLQFVPAVVEVASSAVRRQRKAAPCKAEPGAGTIEVEVDGVMIRVGRGADAETLMAVLRALKAGA
jgi:transposase